MEPLVFSCFIDELPICIVLLAVVCASYPMATVFVKLEVVGPADEPIATLYEPSTLLYNELLPNEVL